MSTLSQASQMSLVRPLWYDCTLWVHITHSFPILWNFVARPCLVVSHTHFVVELLSHAQLFCKPMDCSPRGSSVHGISQARILEWVCHFRLQGIFPIELTSPAFAGRFFTTDTYTSNQATVYSILNKNDEHNLTFSWEPSRQMTAIQ